MREDIITQCAFSTPRWLRLRLRLRFVCFCAGHTEANLDVQYIMGVAPGVLTEFWCGHSLQERSAFGLKSEPLRLQLQTLQERTAFGPDFNLQTSQCETTRAGAASPMPLELVSFSRARVCSGFSTAPVTTPLAPERARCTIARLTHRRSAGASNTPIHDPCDLVPVRAPAFLEPSCDLVPVRAPASSSPPVTSCLFAPASSGSSQVPARGRLLRGPEGLDLAHPIQRLAAARALRILRPASRY